MECIVRNRQRKGEEKGAIKKENHKMDVMQKKRINLMPPIVREKGPFSRFILAPKNRRHNGPISAPPRSKAKK